MHSAKTMFINLRAELQSLQFLLEQKEDYADAFVIQKTILKVTDALYDLLSIELELDKNKLLTDMDLNSKPAYDPMTVPVSKEVELEWVEEPKSGDAGGIGGAREAEEKDAMDELDEWIGKRVFKPIAKYLPDEHTKVTKWDGKVIEKNQFKTGKR